MMDNGEQFARESGWLMVAELIMHDLDLSIRFDRGFDRKAIGSRVW